MRGSVVLRGIKSWVDRFHHPLPLDRKESSRLLAALTSSFRQHLDEVHPPTAAAHGKSDDAASHQSRDVSAAKHSAAVAADRHMSSILTSSLLTDVTSKRHKPPKVDGPDLNVLKTRLSFSETDPLNVLAEFSRRPQATATVASLCMRAFEQRMTGLSNNSKHDYVRTHQPGRRVLSWLEGTGLYGTPQMLREESVMTLLVPYLLIEGHEKHIWRLLALQEGLLPNPDLTGAHGNTLHFKWKSKMLLRLMQFHCNRSHSLDKAIDAFLKAAECEDLVQQHALSHAGQFLYAKLLEPKANIKDRTAYDHTKYDAFINHLRAWADPDHYERKLALLMLYHPERPSPDELLQYLRRTLMAHSEENLEVLLLDTVRQSTRPPTENDVRRMLRTTREQLQAKKMADDLAWLCLTTRNLYPDLMDFTQITAIDSSLPKNASQPSHPSRPKAQTITYTQDQLWWRSPTYG